jgi:hypothetical protein
VEANYLRAHGTKLAGRQATPHLFFHANTGEVYLTATISPAQLKVTVRLQVVHDTEKTLAPRPTKPRSTEPVCGLAQHPPQFWGIAPLQSKGHYRPRDILVLRLIMTIPRGL